jgi:hypothetical protein
LDYESAISFKHELSVRRSAPFPGKAKWDRAGSQFPLAADRRWNGAAEVCKVCEGRAKSSCLGSKGTEFASKCIIVSGPAQKSRMWIRWSSPMFLLYPLNASAICNPTSLCEDILTEAHELGRVEDGLKFCCCPVTGPILTLEQAQPRRRKAHRSYEAWEQRFNWNLHGSTP